MSLDAPLLPLALVAAAGGQGSGKRAVHATSSAATVAALLRKNALLKRREWGQLSCGICGLPPLCPFALFCEVLLPIGLVLFLWWARDKCVSSGQCVAITVEGWGGEVPPGSKSTTCNPAARMGDGTSVTCEPWSDQFSYSHTSTDTGWRGEAQLGEAAPGRRHHGGGQDRGSANFYDILMSATENEERISLSVSDAADIPKVEAMRSWIHENWYPGGLGPCKQHEDDPERPCEHTYWKGFGNITLEKVYLEEDLDAYLADVN